MKIVKIRPQFKLQDFWIGVSWKKHTDWNSLGRWELRITNVWICLIPCFPINIQIVEEIKIK